MKKYILFFVLCLGWATTQAQVVLEVLEGGGYTATQTKSYSKSFTRNNCASGYVGTSVTYTQSATATATSSISQSDANTQAANLALEEAKRLVEEGGQDYANANGKCNASGGGGGGGYVPPLRLSGYWSGTLYYKPAVYRGPSPLFTERVSRSRWTYYLEPGEEYLSYSQLMPKVIKAVKRAVEAKLGTSRVLYEARDIVLNSIDTHPSTVQWEYINDVSIGSWKYY